MFELIEAVRGCLIGSKSWNRSVKIFETHLYSFIAIIGTVFGCLGDNLLNKLCFG